MKKFVLALLVGIMTVATASIAAAEVSVGGAVEVRYDLWNNLDLNDAAAPTETQNFFAQRVLLNVDAKLADGVEAFVELDTWDSERQWGVQSAFTAVSPTNHSGEVMQVKQAWINFMIPGIPVGMKIGHQPLALGHGIFLDSHRMGQDAILLYSKPMPELLVAGVYVKALEMSNASPGLSGFEHYDVDIYAALANYTWCENNTVGVFYLYGHDGADAGHGFVNLGTQTNHLHVLGVIADGAVSGINYKAEFDFQNISADLAGNEVGLRHGWAAMGGVNTNVGPANLGLEVAYGSGSDATHGVAAGNTTNSGSRVFNNPFGTTSYNYAFLYNDKIGQGAGGTGGGFGLGDGTGGFGLANTFFVKVSGSVAPTEKMTAGLDILYLMASEDAVANQSSDLGWEIDANVAYKMYENLDLNVTGGVFIPGDWYEYGVAGANNLSTAYGLETKLTCKF